MNPSPKSKKSVEKAQEKEKPSALREWLNAAVFAVVAAFLINTFLFQNYNVPTGSMERTILPGDFLVVSKLTYGPRLPIIGYRLPGFTDVKQNDIVVFIQPRTDENYVKRCVAIAGQTLEIKNRVMYVDGVESPLPEQGQFIGEPAPPNYIEPSIFPKYAPYNKDNYGPIYIPKKGDTLMLNAQNYEYYRYLLEYEGHQARLINGQVIIDGKPTTTYIVQQNYYFMIGDNRDNSLDSRFWGYVPEKNIVGSPLFIYWSWDPDLPLYNIFGKLASVRWSRIGTIVK
jgi:signal peptidase I, bacterial type